MVGGAHPTKHYNLLGASRSSLLTNCTGGKEFRLGFMVELWAAQESP